MSKFYNNVKSRLNKKGINGFTKADFLKAAEHLMVTDLDDVTTEQILAGVEFLESLRGSQIEVVNNVNTDVYTPVTKSLATYQDPETLTEQEEVSAIAPLEEEYLEPIETSEYKEERENVIAPFGEVHSSSELALSNAEELIQQAINNAPSDIKQNLLIQYAEREFQSASELIAFKHQIDSQIDDFLASELHRTATDRNSKWDKLQQNITSNADKNLAERKQSQTTFLSNLQARIAEFSISSQEN